MIPAFTYNECRFSTVIFCQKGSTLFSHYDGTINLRF